MTEKEKQEAAETIEEKRIKPSVIRRRRTRKVVAPEEEKAAEKGAAPAGTAGAEAETAAAGGTPERPETTPAPPSAPAPGQQPEPAKAQGPSTEKEAQAATATEAAAEPAATEEARPAARKPAVRPAPTEKGAPPAGVRAARPRPEAGRPQKKEPVRKKEVKFFEKAVEQPRRTFPQQPFKKGKGKPRGKRAADRAERPQGRRGQQIHHARPLKKTEITVPKGAKRIIKVVDAISVADLSQRIGVKAGEIIKKLMSLGVMATVNQFIDVDSAAVVAAEFGFEVENAAVQEEELTGFAPAGEEEAEKVPRAPVVTVMGHVDHGKTSLLDAIRETDTVSGEAGGITQHIGAYHVHLDRGDITFLDTPGHEAFTTMRARGAKVTDLVVLVVAANDGVMPQTVEAINHARAAGVPLIVAINKIDLPDADPEKLKQKLTEYDLVPEEWGGDTLFCEISAKKRINIKELLELIILQSEMLELKAVKDAPARGVVVEAKLDKGRGPVSTVLIQSGTLRTGDAFVTGVNYGRVRAMINDRGKRIAEAGPSVPVEILGISGVPQAGDTFIVVKDEATAKQVAAIRQRKAQEKELLKTAKVSLSDLYEKISQGEVKELNLIIKADVHGSIEAVKDALDKLPSKAIKLNVIHGAVGGINEGDVMLAAASNAIIVGFNVRPEPKAQALADREKVDMRLYNVIYDLVDDVRNAMEGMLEPVMREEVLGSAEVRDVIRISRVGNVAGCYVRDGKIMRTAHVRLIRDNVVIYDGKIASLKRFKEDVREVASGYECGILIDGYNDVKVGDTIEAYILKEEAATL
ncbi:MAG TPA: translation initiation factor IF-2 [Deltaproteobacteria bacterium]|nr:translation initiation factor IF-2 [Deltaproteobacteria bacterium]